MTTKVGAMGVAVVLVIGCSAGGETNMTKDDVTTVGVGGSGGSTTSNGGGPQGGAGGDGGDAQGGTGGVGGDGGQGGNGGQMGLPPIVVNADCNVTVGTQVFAEANFPGKTAEDLAVVHTLGVANPAVLPPPPGYQLTQWTTWVRDEYVTTTCGSPATPTLLSVRFILPQ